MGNDLFKGSIGKGVLRGIPDIYIGIKRESCGQLFRIPALVCA